MYNEYIKEELQDILDSEKGCIVFDFGCFFPYANQEILHFDFHLGIEDHEPIKLNHRYPNHGYMTISKKNGRKLSKLGYPYPLELDTDHILLLAIEMGIKDKFVSVVFPVHVKLTKDKPVCSLTMHANFDALTFDLTSCYKDENSFGHYMTRWTNHKEDTDDDKVIYMTPNFGDEKSATVVFGDIIEPHAQKLEDLLIF